MSPVASMAPVDVCHGPQCSLPSSDQRSWGTAAAAGPVGRLGCPSAPDPWGVVCCFPSLSPPTCTVSWASGLLFTAAPARCVVLRVRCPGRLGSCSPVCSLGALCCVCGVFGHLAPVRQCARPLRCVACVVSRATWLLCTGLPARCVVLRVRYPGPLGTSSRMSPLGVLCCVCGVLRHLAPVHQWARWRCCGACALSWVTWLLFTAVLARGVVLRVQCPGPLGSCSLVGSLGLLWCVCGVLGSLAPVHRRARSGCFGAYAVSWAICTCSPVCSIGVVCCVCGVPGHLAPVHRRARSVRCSACAVSWSTWVLFTVVLA